LSPDFYTVSKREKNIRIQQITVDPKGANSVFDFMKVGVILWVKILSNVYAKNKNVPEVNTKTLFFFLEMTCR
jgi:hypothetical protein